MTLSEVKRIERERKRKRVAQAPVKMVTIDREATSYTTSEDFDRIMAEVEEMRK